MLLSRAALGLVYLPFEPLLLSSWGTTPGKALLKVRVRNSDGGKLAYGQAFSRVVKVWFRGTGMRLPLVSLITHWVAYTRLKEHGITSWDEEDDYIVSHRVIGIVPVMVAIFTIGIMIVLTILGSLPE